MDYGFVLDHTFELSWEQQRELARLASNLGYQSAWGPGSANARDGFHAAVQWAQAAPALSTGISVITAPFWTPVTLADQAATVAEITEGRFILGISSGGAYQASVQQAYDMPARPVISLMRDYLKILRGLLDGEEVNYTGKAMSL